MLTRRRAIRPDREFYRQSRKLRLGAATTRTRLGWVVAISAVVVICLMIWISHH